MSDALFDADRTISVSCPVCGAVREPGEEKAALCLIDHERDHGSNVRRPSGCLNAHDPGVTDPYRDPFRGF